MNKKNWIIVGSMLLLAAALMATTALTKTAADEDLIIITVNGAEYARVPLSSPGEIRVDQGDGKVNVIRVIDRGAYMESSTCENQQCVHMGEVTVDNWETRPNQAFIICLPNRVSVELAVKQ